MVLIFLYNFGSLRFLVLEMICRCSVAKLCSTPCDPMDGCCQAPLSMWFSRQEYWIGLPFPFPGDLPDPGIVSAPPMSPALACGFFTTDPPGKPLLGWLGQRQYNKFIQISLQVSCTDFYAEQTFRKSLGFCITYIFVSYLEICNSSGKVYIIFF